MLGRTLKMATLHFPSVQLILFYRRGRSGRKGQSRFGGNRGFFLPSRCRNSRSSACSHGCADQRAFPASRQPADESASSRPAADLLDVTLGVALALGAVTGGCDRNRLV